MPRKKKTTEIKVKKAKDMDFSVPVHVEEQDEIGDLIYKLTELTPKQLRQVYRTAKVFNKANRMTDQLRGEYSDFTEE